MHELIKINFENERPTILGRELHEFLEVDSNYTTWFKRMIEYGFAEGIDFIPIMEESTGGRPSTDFQLSIDMAKEIAMLQRNEKGKAARQYFIEIEKEFNSPEKIMARALRIADATINSLKLETKQQQQIICELQPKATYYDLILQNSSLLSISVIAKDYGMSATAMNKLLHELGIQYCLSGTWLLYQKHADKGYTSSKTQNFNKSDGSQGSKLHTYWTQKGRLFIYQLLKENGILPLIEKEDNHDKES